MQAIYYSTVYLLLHNNTILTPCSEAKFLPHTSQPENCQSGGNMRKKEREEVASLRKVKKNPTYSTYVCMCTRTVYVQRAGL